MAYLLLHSDDPESLKAVLPSLDKAKYVFLPINDNPDVEAIEGGYHWALLVVDVRNQKIHYFDSVTESNYQTAVDTSRRMATLLNRRVRLITADTPQQDNGSDCGVMVCQITVLLVGRMISELGNSRAINHIHPSDRLLSLKDVNLSAEMGRTFIMATILDLLKNGHGHL
jgi:sentrin-specific protease 8